MAQGKPAAAFEVCGGNKRKHLVAGMPHLAPPGRDALTQWGPRACIQTEQAAEHCPASSQLTPRLIWESVPRAEGGGTGSGHLPRREDSGKSAQLTQSGAG